MNTDKIASVRALSLDEVEGVAGATAGWPANSVIPPYADASPSLDGTAAPTEAAGTERISPLRRFLSMRI